MRGQHAPTPKRTRNTPPTAIETKDDSAFTLLKLLIDQILHVIKHQPWVRLLKPSKHDPDPLKAGHCSFHDIQGTPPSIVGPSKDTSRIYFNAGTSMSLSSTKRKTQDVRDTPDEATN